MTKRERLLVIAMTGSVLWGASSMVFGFMRNYGGTARLERDRADLQVFAQSQRTVMDSLRLTGREKMVLDEANAAWAASPFAASMAGPAEERIREFFYTGHVQVGPRQLAIINGREYRTSDPVIASDFIVESIHPDHVVLAATSGSRRITVDLQPSQEKRNSP